MAQIITKQGKELNFDGLDVVEFNNHLRENELKSFSTSYYGKHFFVDLESQEIYIDGELYSKVEEKLENVRWINFRRVKLIYAMSGGREQDISYGIGLHGISNQKSIKCGCIINKQGELKNLE